MVDKYDTAYLIDRPTGFPVYPSRSRMYTLPPRVLRQRKRGMVEAQMKGRLCMLFVVTMATLAAGQTVIKYHSNGAFAQIDTFSNGNIFGSLSVTRNGVGSSAETNMFLSYTVFDSNFNVITSSFGFGTIPGTSLQGAGTGAMNLNLDLSTAPNFTLCTFTPNIGTTCASPAQGTIDLAWRKLDQFSYHSVNNLTQSYPGVRYQVSGTADGNSASVQGTSSAHCAPWAITVAS